MSKRPPHLETLLNIVDKSETLNNNNVFNYVRNQQEYANFLAAAHMAQENSERISVKLGWHQMKSRDYSRTNCSLCVMFYFYAKTTPIHSKTGRGASAEDIESARQSLSFFELMLLCRDFRLVPYVLAKEEVHFLWHLTLAERVKKGGGNLRSSRLISFEDFNHLLGRAAILAFNKAGMKRILRMSSSEWDDGHSGDQDLDRDSLSQSQMIRLFARYLHLEDVQWVRRRVRTVGKSTVGLINQRTSGDGPNTLQSRHLRDDLRGVRLARMMTLEDRQEETPSTVAAAITAPSKLVETESNEAKNATKSVNEKNEKIKSQIETPGVPIESSSSRKEVTFGLGTISEGSTEDACSEMSSVCGSQKKKNPDRGSDCGCYDIDPNTASAYEEAKRKLDADTALTLGELQQYLALSDEGYVPEDDASHRQTEKESSGISYGRDNNGNVTIRGGLTLTAVQLKEIKDYHPERDRTTNWLSRFSSTSAYFQHKSYSKTSFNATNESTSGYLDMGVLTCGAKVLLRLHIVNKFTHSVQVDISTEGLGLGDEGGEGGVTNLPSSLAPGLGCMAYVAFVVKSEKLKLLTHTATPSTRNVSGRGPVRSENVLGMVTLTVHCPADQSAPSISTYPVFFRTEPADPPALNPASTHQLKSPRCSPTDRSCLVAYPLCCPASIDSLIRGEHIRVNDDRRHTRTPTPSASDLKNALSHIPSSAAVNHRIVHFEEAEVHEVGDRMQFLTSRKRSLLSTSSSIRDDSLHQPTAPTGCKPSSAAAGRVGAIKRRLLVRE